VLACALTSQSVKGRALTLLATSSAHSGGRLCTADDKVAPRGRRRWVLLTRLLIPAQVCFGPVLGVIASGLLFGSDDALLWRVGDQHLGACGWPAQGAIGPGCLEPCRPVPATASCPLASGCAWAAHGQPGPGQADIMQAARCDTGI